MNFLKVFGNRASVAALLIILAGPWIEAVAAKVGWPAADIVAALASAIVFVAGYVADRLVTAEGKP
jgi:hypothetical protein